MHASGHGRQVLLVRYLPSTHSLHTTVLLLVSSPHAAHPYWQATVMVLVTLLVLTSMDV